MKSWTTKKGKPSVYFYQFTEFRPVEISQAQECSRSVRRLKNILQDEYRQSIFVQVYSLCKNEIAVK